MKKFEQFLEQKKHPSLEPLPYETDDLSPIMSKSTINYHYGKLAKSYVEKYNRGKGDPGFNEAGAFLHNIFFPQLQPPEKNNQPTGKILNFINKHFGSYDNFKKEIEKVAMAIQGSGWVYLSKSGAIKTIENHEIRNDIVLLIDWWEHAWALDYQADKQRYINNIWSIINWSNVSKRVA
jgi:Fe-Mn family superoxide dismutase